MALRLGLRIWRKIERVNRKFILIFGTLGILAGIVFFAFKGPPEPTYQGRRLSQWLFEQRVTDKGGIELSDASASAVQAIGTNGFPVLLAMLNSSDSQFKLRLAMRVQGYPLLGRLIPMYMARRFAAMLGFRVLGAAAKPVSPHIVKMVLHSDDNLEAINALGAVANDADSALAMVKELSNPDPVVRRRAALALTFLRQAPDISLPALAQALKDPAQQVSMQAACSLGAYGSAAQPIIPLLTELSTNSDAGISLMAAQALQRIAQSIAIEELSKGSKR